MKLREIKESLTQMSGMSVDELGAKERELSNQLFEMRIQKSMGQLEAPEKMKDIRRNLARLKTVIRSKQS